MTYVYVCSFAVFKNDSNFFGNLCVNFVFFLFFLFSYGVSFLNGHDVGPAVNVISCLGKYFISQD